MPVKEGSELTLECAAEGGNPPPVLAWGMILSQATLDGPEQPPDNLTVLPSTSARHSGAHLKVLRGHHNATIVCVARHVTLTVPMNASILLDVQCKFTFFFSSSFYALSFTLLFFLFLLFSFLVDKFSPTALTRWSTMLATSSKNVFAFTKL